MRRWQEETVKAPLRHLCPMCRDSAQSYSRYEDSRLKDEAEEALRDGSAKMPERIKAAWERYGKGWDWSRSGPVVRAAEPLYRLSPRYVPPEGPMEAVKYDTFQFARTSTRNSWGTVHRVSCMGVTVEETFDYAD